MKWIKPEGEKTTEAAKYHYFYLPVTIPGKLYVAHIVGEDFNDSTESTLIDVKLCDVIIAKKGTSPTATQGDLLVENVPLRITVAEMLKNVKDTYNILTYLYQRN